MQRSDGSVSLPDCLEFSIHESRSIESLLSTSDSPEAPNTVVQVFQKGYRLQDRVLRPALVAVAKAREDTAPGPADA